MSCGSVCVEGYPADKIWQARLHAWNHILNNGRKGAPFSELFRKEIT